MLVLYAHSGYSIGLMYGPVVNEQYLIENDGKFPITSYDFPLFIGGVYHRFQPNNYIFYHVDLCFDIHSSKIYEKDEEISMQNYVLYFHNDINVYVLEKIAYMGLGMEVIGMYTRFSEPFNDFDNYISYHYFCYLNGGINIPIGKIEIGVKLLYRLLPFTDSVSGKGEISVLVGLSSFGKKQPAKKGK
jgi:hypothetical protein